MLPVFRGPGLLMLFLYLVPGKTFANNPEAIYTGSILNEVFKKNQSIKTISYTLRMKERINNEYKLKKTDFKVSLKPYKVYLKQLSPDNIEILYSKEETGDKAFLNRNSRAFSNMNLNPVGNMMRKESHHSIFKGGYNYLLDVLEHLYKKYPEDKTGNWQYEGMVKYNDVACYKITFNNPGFSFTTYTIQAGENLEVLSQKLKICDYMIFENNPKLKSFDDFKPGTVIRVPTDYAKQIILYIDAEKFLALGLKIFDDKGLFDEYTYENIMLNPEFSDNEFRPENPAYGFMKRK